MKVFFGEDVFLKSKTAISLYEKYAKNQPIYDYHCHLNPQEIAEDKVYFDVGELMLKGDHYKWRLMRHCGMEEELITGNASFKDKFVAYAKALSMSIGSPLYHWTHMELKKYFNINEPLTEKNAIDIYLRANKAMEDGSFSAKQLITKSNVYMVATTDDPSDGLNWHKKIALDKNFKTKVLPTFRPDLACNIAKKDYVEYINKLAAVEDEVIVSLEDLQSVLKKRLDLFATMGCKIADHGIENIPQVEADFEEAHNIFGSALARKRLSPVEAEKFLFYMLTFFASEYKRRGWAMQIHMSVIRNQNSARFDKLGPDVGNDSAGDVSSAKALGRLFDRIETKSGMPKTIVYSLNPTSNMVLSTMLGNFAGGLPGKMQFGAAWWFCDNRTGIEEQLKMLADTGVLGQFVGMLTDSRSFISYPRHDYFRRILCSIIGEWVENGELTNDDELLGEIVKGICFENARKYFDIKE